MSKKPHAGALDKSVTGNEPLRLAESPAILEFSPIHKDREPNNPSDMRPKFQGLAPKYSEELSSSINRQAKPDLRTNCPICGTSYRPGENVVALGCLSVATSAVPAWPFTSGSDAKNEVILGHRECVLPRLLTLLASFQPELRFVKASRDLRTV